MTDSFIGNSSDNLTQEQYAFFQNAAVSAFRLLSDASESLDEIGAGLIVATVSIRVPGCDNPKLVSLASPNIKPEVIRELYEFLGRDPDMGVDQSQMIIQMATYQTHKEQVEKCAQCPDREECDERIDKETIQ